MTTADKNIDERLKVIEEKLNALPISGIANALQALQGLVIGAHNKAQRDIILVRNDLDGLKLSVGLAIKRIPVPKGRKIRCVFMVHHISFWGTFAPILAAMNKADDFEPIVITVRYDEEFCKRQGFTWEEEAHKGLTELGVRHLRFSMPDSYQGLDILKALAPDIIFRQGPWDDSFPPGYKSPELSFARLCYIDYSFAMPNQLTPDAPAAAAGASADHHADQLFHRLCWKIFCETDMHRDMYARASTRGDTNLESVGYTKFDDLLETARTKPSFWPIANKDGKRRFRIIWAPHCSVTSDYLGFGMFQDVYKDMLAWAKERTDMEFVLRPHPMTYGHLVHKKVMAKEELDAFLAAWVELPNAARFEGGDYGPFFAASDAMVTDGVGFFAEYQLFRKPLIWLDSQRHSGFNDAGKLVIASANRVTTVDEARALCDRLQKGEPDPMRALQEKNLPSIHPYPGQSAAKILDVIRDGLAKERGE